MKYDGGPLARAGGSEMLETGEPVLDLPRIRSAALEAAAAELAAILFPGTAPDTGYLKDCFGSGVHWMTRAFAAHALHVLPPRVLMGMHAALSTSAPENILVAHLGIEYVQALYNAQDWPRESWARLSREIGNALVFSPVLAAAGRHEPYPLAGQDLDELLNWALDGYESGRLCAFVVSERRSAVDYGSAPRKQRDEAAAYVLVAVLSTRTGAHRDCDPELVRVVRKGLRRADEIARAAHERGRLDAAALASILSAQPALADGAL